MGASMPYLCEPRALPNWVPEAAQRYLQHTKQGLSIRAVARNAGCHASTILRQIRRFENRRDDPLVDEALSNLGRQHFPTIVNPDKKDSPEMSAPIRHANLKTDDATLNREGRRILRRLS